MSEMKWEDPAPAPKQSPRGHWADVADELRAHPGHWALIRESPHRELESCKQLAARIRRGDASAFLPRKTFETAVRSNASEDWSRVYVRYVGGGAS